MGLLLSAGLRRPNGRFPTMNDDDPRSKSADEQEHSPEADDTQDTKPGHRRLDPVFTEFDEDFEEWERDTDYGSAYEDEDSGEENIEPPGQGDTAETASDWQLPEDSPRPTGTAGGGDKNPFASKDSTVAPGDQLDLDTDDFGAARELELFDREEEPATEDEDWEDREAYIDEPENLEDNFQDEAAARAQRWPLGLVVVGIVALVLLAAGGYGVIQQRSAAQEEILALQAALATAASPAEVDAAREAVRVMEQQAEQNTATIELLTLYNKRLSDTVEGLEQQLAAQQAKAPGASSSTAAAKTAVAAAKNAGAAAAATVAEGGDWFVNFGSYGQRGAADTWAGKLRPVAGKAVVAPTNRDGKTFYRVRIVGLADRAQAEKVAGQLQSTYKLPPLWVGTE